MITPRQAFLTLEYDGKDISSDIRKDVENFTYTDSGSDSSDSLSIKVNAMDHKWIDSVDAWGQHSAEGCYQGYYVDDVKTGTIHHEATGHNEQKWVQDSAAWTETVTTGYKCSGCGATK